jgi:hypothetical protein
MAYKPYVPAKKAPENISLFKNRECMLVMSKPKSPLTVAFYPEPPDGYLITLVQYKTKSGEIVHESMVIEPDLKRFIEIYTNDGYVKN